MFDEASKFEANRWKMSPPTKANMVVKSLNSAFPVLLQSDGGHPVLAIKVGNWRRGHGFSIG